MKFVHNDNEMIYNKRVQIRELIKVWYKMKIFFLSTIIYCDKLFYKDISSKNTLN